MLIHRPLLRRKISLGLDGLRQPISRLYERFWAILKGSDLGLGAEILVRFVFLYFLIHRPLIRRKISLGPYGVTQSEI